MADRLKAIGHQRLFRRLSQRREERLLLAKKDRQKYLSRMLELMHTNDEELEKLYKRRSTTP